MLLNMELGRDVHCGSGEPVGACSSTPVPRGRAHKFVFDQDFNRECQSKAT